MDCYAIPFGLIGMPAFRTNERQHGVPVLRQSLGKVNGKNRLPMEGDILRKSLQLKSALWQLVPWLVHLSPDFFPDIINVQTLSQYPAPNRNNEDNENY